MQNNVLYCERSEYVDGCFWVLQLFSSISVILCVGGGGGGGGGGEEGRGLLQYFSHFGVGESGAIQV